MPDPSVPSRIEKCDQRLATEQTAPPDFQRGQLATLDQLIELGSGQASDDRGLSNAVSEALQSQITTAICEDPGLFGRIVFGRTRWVEWAAIWTRDTQDSPLF